MAPVTATSQSSIVTEELISELSSIEPDIRGDYGGTVVEWLMGALAAGRSAPQIMNGNAEAAPNSVDAAAALAMFTTGLDALAVVDPVTLSPDEALERTRVLLVAKDRLEALTLAAVALLTVSRRFGSGNVPPAPR